MNKLNYTVKGILGSVLVLLLFACDKQTANNTPFVGGDSIGVRLPVAYINTDSLLNKYQFVIDKNEESLKKLEDKRLNIRQRAEKFHKEVLEYQQKAQMNAYYSRERQQQEETRLNRRQQELEEAANQAEQELATEQMNMNRQLQDSLTLAIKEFNKGQYQMIFSNSGASTFFYVDESYDITEEVVLFLNARYKPVRE